MSYVIEVSQSAAAELKALRAFDRTRLAEAIDTQLVDQPNVETRNRKHLEGVTPRFEHVPPLWELRVGEYRIFCDI